MYIYGDLLWCHDLLLTLDWEANVLYFWMFSPFSGGNLKMTSWRKQRNYRVKLMLKSLFWENQTSKWLLLMHVLMQSIAASLKHCSVLRKLKILRVRHDRVAYGLQYQGLIAAFTFIPRHILLQQPMNSVPMYLLLVLLQVYMYILSEAAWVNNFIYQAVLQQIN